MAEGSVIYLRMCHRRLPQKQEREEGVYSVIPNAKQRAYTDGELQLIILCSPHAPDPFSVLLFVSEDQLW